MAMATQTFYSPTRLALLPKTSGFNDPQPGLSTGISEVESCQTRGGSQVLGSNQVIEEFGQESPGIDTVPCSC
jgi:hypothetical protein